MLSAGIGYRSNDFSGSFNVKESEDFFKLLHLYFTDVSIEERDLKNFKTQMLKNLALDKGEVNNFRDSVTKLRYSKNPVYTQFDSAFVNSLKAEQLMNLYKSQFMNPWGYTFVFTGPMESEKGKELVMKYISSIKGEKFKSSKPVYKEPTTRSGEVELRYKAKNMLSTKAEVTRIYHGATEYSAYNNLMAKFITYILRERYMKSIREERGGTYHVGVSGDMIKYPSPVCRFTIEFDTDPALVKDLLDVVQAEIDKFALSGPTEKEMKETSLYLSKVYQDRKDLTPWNSIIVNSLQGEVDLSLEEKNLLGQMNSSAIQKYAKQIFGNKNRMTFVFEPEN